MYISSSARPTDNTGVEFARGQWLSLWLISYVPVICACLCDKERDALLGIEVLSREFNRCSLPTTSVLGIYLLLVIWLLRFPLLPLANGKRAPKQTTQHIIYVCSANSDACCLFNTYDTTAVPTAVNTNTYRHEFAGYYRWICPVLSSACSSTADRSINMPGACLPKRILLYIPGICCCKQYNTSPTHFRKRLVFGAVGSRLPPSPRPMPLTLSQGLYLRGPRARCSQPNAATPTTLCVVCNCCLQQQ